MNLKHRNIAITAFTAALLASGILATANAAQYDAISSLVEIERGSTVETKSRVQKKTPSGSDAFITFNNAISPYDTVIVHIKNEKGNVVSTDDGRWRAVSAGTTKRLQYLPNKGKFGNAFYPVFSLDNGSQSSSIYMSYEFIP